ncbi:MAG: GNAT family N-acetyltransferase [Actinomycetota bacterium]
MRIETATHEDFLEILRDLPDFWATSGPEWRTLPYHYPFLVHEFADTAFVVHDRGSVIAYLFGFVATAEPVGYIHLVGVRAAHQGTGLGRALYEHFVAVARERGCTHLRAVTAPFNTDSQAFHAALGFEPTGPSSTSDGLPIYPDYHGPREDVIIFSKRIA